MRAAFVVLILVLSVGCGGENTSQPPEAVDLSGDTAWVSVDGSADTQAGELENIRWNRPDSLVEEWLLENGFKHRSTKFDTERMEALGYENFVSEDQTGLRIFGISVWTRP